MANLKKALVLTTIGGGLVAGGLYLRSLKRTGKKLETNCKVGIAGIDFKGLTLRVDLVLKNPTGTGITIKYPYVRLIMGDDTIGSSDIVNQNIKIPAYGEAHVDKIMIHIPIGGLLTLAASLFMPLQNGEAVRIHIITITGISLLWMTIPYEKKEEVTLRVGSNGSINTASNTARKKIQSPNPQSKADGNNSKAGSDSTGHSATDTEGGGSNQMADQDAGTPA